MRRLILFVVLSCLPVTLALAQSGSSRLDEIVKSGKLRVCTPGDYKPFSFFRPDGAYEGLDIDLVQASAKALGVEVEMVKSAWPTLMKDFIEKCDVAVGGISVTLDRQKTAFFTAPYMVNGKAPITKCENAAKFQTVADIDKPGVTVIENPGGSNERFARANFKQAKIVIFNDNGWSISENIGWLTHWRNRLMLHPKYQKLTEAGQKLLSKLPLGEEAWGIAR